VEREVTPVARRDPHDRLVAGDVVPHTPRTRRAPARLRATTASMISAAPMAGHRPPIAHPAVVNPRQSNPPARLVGRDVGLVASVRPMSSRPFQQAVVRVVVEVERSSRSSGPASRTRRSTTSTTSSNVGSSVTARMIRSTTSPGSVHRDEADLQAVVSEDVGEAGRDHGRRSRSPAGPTARARATSPCRSWVRPPGSRPPGSAPGEHEGRVLAPFGEEPLPKPVRSTRLSQSLGMIWSVSTSERSSGTALPRSRVPASCSSSSVVRGAGCGPPRRGARSQVGRCRQAAPDAVAAATIGDTRCVRPPCPGDPRSCGCSCWRPLTRRELVGVSWPGTSSSPASRHSKPAARKTTSRPSASASTFTANDPGTDEGAHAVGDATAPEYRAPAARRSSSRAFVQDPMNTVSTAMSRHRRSRGQVPCRPGRARRRTARRDRRTTTGRARRRRGWSSGRGWCPS